MCAGKKGSSGELLGVASSDDKSGNALHVSVSFSTLDISMVDHIPEELIAVTIQGLSFGMALGIGPEGTFQRMQLSVQKLQIDDQLSASRCIALCEFCSQCMHVHTMQASIPSHTGITILQCMICQCRSLGAFLFHYNEALT